MRVTPVRFTADVPGLRRFTEALGLRSTMVSGSGDWATAAAAAGGAVAMHTAAAADPPRAPGTTELSFETDEPLEDLQQRLRVAGFEAVVVDEAFGRSLRVVDPDGVEVQVNAVMTDHYGYTVTPDPSQPRG